MRLKDRLKAFAVKHGLSHTEMAAKLSTPYPTFANWMLTNDKQPPACMVTLLDILENVPEAREFLKISDEARLRR